MDYTYSYSTGHKNHFLWNIISTQCGRIDLLQQSKVSYILKWHRIHLPWRNGTDQLSDFLITINPSKLSDCCIRYTICCNIKKLYILPTQWTDNFHTQKFISLESIHQHICSIFCGVWNEILNISSKNFWFQMVQPHTHTHTQFYQF
jgi:hypothetical protein